MKDKFHQYLSSTMLGAGCFHTWSSQWLGYVIYAHFQIKKPWDGDTSSPSHSWCTTGTVLDCRLASLITDDGPPALINTQKSLHVAYSSPECVIWVSFLCNCLWESPEDESDLAKLISEDSGKQRFSNKVLKPFALGLALFQRREQQEWAGVQLSVGSSGECGGRGGQAGYRIYGRTIPELSPACSASLQL